MIDDHVRSCRVAVAAIGLLLGCGAVPVNLDPVAMEDRAVVAASDPAKTVTVREGMVWYDADPASRGIRFPGGTYVLEAEDPEYWYFRAPAPIELRKFEAGRMAGGQDLPGGIMLAKLPLRMTPAAGYVDAKNGGKTLVWRLGNNFLRREGLEWSKTF